MKNNRKNELDVDYIGGMEPLTKEEEKAISDYIKSKKSQTRKRIAVRKTLTVKREKSIA